MIYNRGARKALTVADYQSYVSRKLSRDAKVFLDTGAGSDRGVLRNEQSWSEVLFSPRTLAGLEKVDSSIKIGGEQWRSPIGFAPVGALQSFHSNGESALVRASQDCMALPIIASHSSVPLSEIRGLAGSNWWFQLYLHKDRRLSHALVNSALELGAKAIVLTVDLPVVGYRDQDRQRATRSFQRKLPGQQNSSYPSLGFSNPDATRLPEHRRVEDSVLDPKISRNDLRDLIAGSDVPIFVKGVLRSDDALDYINMGAAGVIISNHGGRGLESSVSPARTLRKIRKKLGWEAIVMVDGGIRRGEDVAKALCLGANMVFIGRPYVWGLAAAGASGVQAVFEILEAELRSCMYFLGARNTNELDESLIWTSS